MVNTKKFNKTRPNNSNKLNPQTDILIKSCNLKENLSSLEEELIAEKYKVNKKIGHGSYGQIWMGTNTQTDELVAIKLESRNSFESQLAMENKVYQLLRGKKGFPNIYYFGQHCGRYVLVMEMLDRNLESMFQLCGHKFTLKTIIFIGVQLLSRFEQIHQCGIIYRDVKPENFMLATTSSTIYVVDFGLSKPYRDMTGAHIRYRQTHELIGTTRYMSVRAHDGKEQSRRDDLEALCYVLLYFLRGKLPWSGLVASNFKKHNQMICALKRDTPLEELFHGFPIEFSYFMTYVRHLRFIEEPNYEKVRLMFKRLFTNRLKYQNDGQYDWHVQQAQVSNHSVAKVVL